jgi:hypothetical protein
MEIRLDGVSVWNFTPRTYATRPADIAVGEHYIGSSSSEEKFTGQIYDLAPSRAMDSKNKIANPRAPTPPSLP